jgi:phosphatidylglycerol:prolipoprotein diacylglycerol transferase
MPLLALPFPAFDPVAIAIGPLAIRWYALAYIVGILGGWLYARALIRNERFWGGPAPLTVTDYDDFVLWVTLGIILGGRIGYVLFYNPAIGLLLGGLANFINGELWGRPSDVPWAMVFPGGGPLPRHPSQLYEALLEGVALLLILALCIRGGALKRPGLTIGIFAVVYALFRVFAEFFREPDPQLGFLWGELTMGMLLSVPLMLAGWGFIWSAYRRSLPRATQSDAA